MWFGALGVVNVEMKIAAMADLYALTAMFLLKMRCRISFGYWDGKWTIIGFGSAMEKETCA